jgi:hypothetical protein
MNYYCKYCGTKAPSIASLVAAPCFRHPAGANKAITSQHSNPDFLPQMDTDEKTLRTE